MKPSDIGILPGRKRGNFDELLSFFYDTQFQKEMKFGRFKVDFYSEEMKLAFEYDGIQHYSVIQKIESDKRKNKLLEGEGIKVVRWPYYYMPTKDTCKYIFQDHYSDQKFLSMLKTMFGTDNESEMSSPGFHTTANIPANFIWPGIDKFINELDIGPSSITHQVRHSLKLYCQKRAKDNSKIVIPTYHEKFMEFFNRDDDAVYLDLVYRNGFKT
tara:strand:- start:44 stop:685 length:642 start_codon:yes stop_codon:yes gene_type:complete